MMGHRPALPTFQKPVKIITQSKIGMKHKAKQITQSGPIDAFTRSRAESFLVKSSVEGSTKSDP